MDQNRPPYSSLITKEGSVEFQINNLTNRVLRLTFHLKQHSKDYSSQRGLRKILGKRKRLLAHLAKTNPIHYENSINRLGIRKSGTR
uniref:Small ribosomal subunit protein uS15c n=1 Tax=Mankyua chejuensis TaxID=996148 RepID=H8Y669_9MONI|nr:ribosomal protein S15 [Mankyua chejuensis]ADZ48037.1 ribosomal protein S15 [Mankyua chejuensis]AJJ48668.1 ribosomal protein S15 [Mankyua chejuensis]